MVFSKFLYGKINVKLDFLNTMQHQHKKDDTSKKIILATKYSFLGQNRLKAQILNFECKSSCSFKKHLYDKTGVKVHRSLERVIE